MTLDVRSRVNERIGSQGKLKRRAIILTLLFISVAAPAITYAALGLRSPSDESAAAPVALPGSSGARASGELSEEAAMVMAGMALIGAAAVVRRAA